MINRHNINGDIMELLLLCIKIFFVRILDVSIGTVRSIITIKGNNFVASLIGFFEVLVWFLVAKEALDTDNNSIFIAISYSLGFATGTYLGGYLSNILIKVKLGLQVILSNNDKNIVKIIRDKGYAVSVMDVKGKNFMDTRYMLFIEIESDRYNELTNLIKSLDEKAFIVVNETKYVHNGYFAK